MTQFIHISPRKGINLALLASWDDWPHATPPVLWITYAVGAVGAMGFEPLIEHYEGEERLTLLHALQGSAGSDVGSQSHSHQCPKCRRTELCPYPDICCLARGLHETFRLCTACCERALAVLAEVNDLPMMEENEDDTDHAHIE